MSKDIGQLGAKVLLDLRVGTALVPSLTLLGKVRLSQFTDLLTELEHEPVVRPGDAVTLGIGGRDGFDFYLQTRNIHAPSIAG